MSWSNGTVRCDGCRVDMDNGKDWVSFGAFGADVDDRRHYHQACWQTGWYTGIEPKGEWLVDPKCWCGHDCGHPWAHEENPPNPHDPTDLRVPPFERVSHIDFDEPALDHIKGDRLRQVPEAEDPVNSPSHYRQLPNGVEVIQITENFDFLVGNVLKYVLRAEYKGKPLEDWKKARWYLDRAIERRERDNGNDTPVV